MPAALDNAISKCMNRMMKDSKLSPEEAKGRCIGHFKNIGMIKQQGRHLGLTKKGKGKMAEIYSTLLDADIPPENLPRDDELPPILHARAAAAFLRFLKSSKE